MDTDLHVILMSLGMKGSDGDGEEIGLFAFLASFSQRYVASPFKTLIS